MAIGDLDGVNGPDLAVANFYSDDVSVLLNQGDGTFAVAVEFNDKDAWIAAVGKFTTIDFTGFPDGTFITNQYADLGVLFTDGNDSIDATCAHVNDCFGLDGNPSMHLSFDSPQLWLAVDFPGDVQIDLFSGDTHLHRILFIAGGLGNFAGVISTEQFNTVVISDPSVGDVFIDDLHFGGPVCPGDVDGDGMVGVPDLLALLTAWGTNPGGPPDFDGDGVVAVPDLLTLLAAWGPCP